MYPSPTPLLLSPEYTFGNLGEAEAQNWGDSFLFRPAQYFFVGKMGVCAQHSARGFFRHSGRENVCQGRKGSGRKGEGDQRT